MRFTRVITAFARHPISAKDSAGGRVFHARQMRVGAIWSASVKGRTLVSRRMLCVFPDSEKSEHGPSLLRQPDFPHQLSKPWIGV